jgi:preprotein translocase subunit SecG
LVYVVVAADDHPDRLRQERWPSGYAEQPGHNDIDQITERGDEWSTPIAITLGILALIFIIIGIVLTSLEDKKGRERWPSGYAEQPGHNDIDQITERGDQQDDNAFF